MTAPNKLPARDRFFELLRAAIHDGTLGKLTLGKHRGADTTLKNVFVRPVALKTGAHLAFVWRHATRDVTKNHAPAAHNFIKMIRIYSHTNTQWFFL